MARNRPRLCFMSITAPAQLHFSPRPPTLLPLSTRIIAYVNPVSGYILTLETLIPSQLCWLVICYSVVYGSYIPKSKHTNDRVSYCFFSLFPWLSSCHPDCSRCHSSTLIVQDIAPSPQMSRMLLHRSNGTTRKIDPVHPEQSLFFFLLPLHLVVCFTFSHLTLLMAQIDRPTNGPAGRQAEVIGGTK